MYNRRTALTISIWITAATAILDHTRFELGVFPFLKGLTTLFIIVYFIRFANHLQKSIFRIVFAGLIFCLLGDLLLLDDRFFVFGLSAFLIAHILFTVSFTKRGGFKWYWLPLLILGGIGIGYYAYLFPMLREMAIPVAAYVLAIVIMSWQGVSMWLNERSLATKMIAIAVVLFMFSDSMIAWGKFVAPFAGERVLILSTYWTSIFLLAAGWTEIDIIHE